MRAKHSWPPADTQKQGLSNAEKVDAPDTLADDLELRSKIMDIETSNAIKLFFPTPSLVQVFFEAVANALDASASEISIHVEIQSFSAPNTLKISITDNGSGFTDESFERFKRLLKTQDSFHKGLGRLVFLNYFGRIAVDSIWGTNRRTFVFSESFNGQSKVAAPTFSGFGIMQSSKSIMLW